MSDQLLRKLRQLEEEYVSQPLVVQQADLREINQLRAQLGMPLVNAHLKEIGTVAVANSTQPQPNDVPDHTKARAIYQAYLKKVEELEVHRAYAMQVAEATSGPGMTPVRPLATMGTNGGPLLCDHCGKPIVLEGGEFHGVTADVAWRHNPRDNWLSYIFGGMVVDIQTNGTLRIYHGYPGRDNKHCCNIANRQGKEARDAFDSTQRGKKRPLILAFIKHEFPNLTNEAQFDLLKNILDTMFSYDPGLGINRPSKQN